MTKLRVFFKNFFSHLFGLGEVVLVGVFEKSPDILLLCWNPYIAPSLTPCLKAILCPPKQFPSLNPRLKAVLSTYPTKNSPTIPYRNFWSRKTTSFLKKVSISLLLHRKQISQHRADTFSSNPLPQLSEPKNEAFSESFSKKCSHPSTARFWSENGHAFQKSFPKSVPQVFLSESQHRKGTIFYSYTAAFILKI